jgi:hypothetical protein
VTQRFVRLAGSGGRRSRPKAASRSLTGAAVQLPQTGRSCLAQRDRAGKVCYAELSLGRSFIFYYSMKYGKRDSRPTVHPRPSAAVGDLPAADAPMYDFTVRAGLNEIEARLLELAVKLAQSRESNGLAELMVDELEWPRDRAIALMGGLDRGAVRVALGPRSRLSRAGLLELDSDFMGGRHRSLTFLRNFTSPVMEAPCSWKMFFARSTPMGSDAGGGRILR